MLMTSPTPLQKKVLAYIRSHLSQQQGRVKRPPTLEQIRAKFGWASRNAAANHLLALRKKGLLKANENGRLEPTK